MILYSVTIHIAKEFEVDWLDWMRNVHVPAVLATGCFRGCRMCKSLEPSDQTETAYFLQYECTSLETYERYRKNFAPALQKEHTDRYSGRFRGERMLLEEVAKFPPRR